MMERIDLKNVYKDTEANWKAGNPLLPKGIIALASDTHIIKLTDGVHTYNELDFVGGNLVTVEDAEKVLETLVSKEDLDTEVAGLTSEIEKKADSATVEKALESKQDALSDGQISAIDSGITEAKVKAYDGYGVDLATVQTTLTTKADASVVETKASKEEVESAVTSLSTANENEVTRAKEAEATLTASVEANASAIEGNTSAITEEATRAKAAEKAIEEEVAKKANTADVDSSEVVTTKDQNIYDALVARISALEAKVNKCAFKTVTSQKIDDSTATITVSADEDVAIVGDRTVSTSLTAKSIEYSDSAVSNDARLTLLGTDSVSMSNMTYSGTFNTKTHAVTIAKSPYVTISDTTYDSSVTCYNPVEIGLVKDNSDIESHPEYSAQNITIENVNLEGSCKNNLISIFNLTDNAVVNISNCHAHSCANFLRLSNASLANNVTINITNCSCDIFSESNPYKGLFLMQDYFAKTTDEAKERNEFSGKSVAEGGHGWKINITNFKMPDGTMLKVDDIASACGNGKDDQLTYIYTNGEDVVAYSEDRYPVITVK